MKAPTITKPIPSTQTRTVELFAISTNTQVDILLMTYGKGGIILV
jgi:hypothetical protein